MTAWKTAGTVADAAYDPNSEGMTTTWTSPTNAQGAANTTYATMGFTGVISGFGQLYSLRASSFGFTSSDVPAGATIQGIEVRVTLLNNQTSGTLEIVDRWAFIVPASGTLGAGDGLGDTFNYWPPSSGTRIYGGSSELWGQTWTQADILDTDFGFMILAAMGTFDKGSASVASVDSFEIRVHYSTVATNQGAGFLQFFF